MTAKLIVTAGPDKGRTFELKTGETLQVGRSQATTTRLTDLSVSRVHCEIEVGEDLVTLHNNSAAGTLVNGESVTERVLQPGDTIRLGATELRYVADQPAGAGQGRTADDMAVQDLERLVGQRLADYQVESVIAHGLSGIVFKANDLTQNQRTIALKVLLPEISKDEEEMQRFVRAMKTMIPVRHPHLIAIHGAGKTGPYCWIAMELFEGQSLTEVIQSVGKGGTFDWKDAYRVAVQIGRALEYAHELSIVHRNITPANILFRPRDRIAKLGDLMLAKALEGRMAQNITKPGQLIGDAAFMAPERTQASAKIDTRSDLYGLGATLYAMLTGRPPFESASLAELINRIRSVEPEPPKKSQPSIPDAFNAVVLKLLAKKPEDRHASAKVLLAELDQLGQSQKVSAYF
jgi:serine/threonine protein kinase